MPIEDRRRRFPILVPEASASGMVAVIRSLGAAGYPVHACSSRSNAIGLSSNFVASAVCHPDYGSEGFIPWLRSYVEEHGVRLIVPSEGFYIAIRQQYEEFEPILATTCSQSTVFRCLSKVDVFESFLSDAASSMCKANIPRTLTFDLNDKRPVDKDLSQLTYPAFLKTDACRVNEGDFDGVIKRVHNPEQAIGVLSELSTAFDKALVQESASGRKATYNSCFVNGELLAESMCLASHESPHTGGLTSLRHTWWHEEMRQDALARIENLGWDGVSMMEYKWDAQKEKFTFIEMNSRYWAALHLDLFAGTDFPRYQVDAILGHGIQKSLGPQAPLTARIVVPAEFGYAVSSAKDSSLPVTQRIWALIEFLLLGFSPQTKADYFFPGDRMLYFRNWWRFLKGLIRSGD